MFSWLDLIIVVYLLAMAFLGFRYGLFRRFLHIGAFYVGLLLAQALSPGLAEVMGYQNGPYPAAAHFGVFLFVLFGLVVIGEGLMFGFSDALSAMNALIFDRFFGLVVGVVAGVFELAVVIYLFQYMAATPLQLGAIQPEVVNYFSAQMGTPSARLLNKLHPEVYFLYGPVLPSEPGNYFAKTFS